MAHYRGSLCRLSDANPLAQRTCLPSLRWHQRMADSPTTNQVRGLSETDIGGGWHSPSRAPQAASYLASGSLIYHQSKDWRKCSWVDACHWLWSLPDGMDLVAQDALGHGTPRMRPAGRAETYFGGKERGVNGRHTNAWTSGIRMLSKFADTLMAHREGFVAYYDFPMSADPLEGTNNKIKTVKRQAYCFRDMDFL